MDLIEALVSLGVGLIGLLLTVSIFCLVLSMPGWFIGSMTGVNSPHLKTIRRGPSYWLAWMFLGNLPLVIGVTGGALAGAGQFIPTPLAIILGIGGIVVANVSAFFIGYKQGLAVKARREVRKSLKNGFNSAGAHAPNEPDLLNENHPAIASTPMATRPLPVVDADRPLDGDTPTQETQVRNTAPLDDEYPVARPHEG